jgi:hypothetical protein
VDGQHQTRTPEAALVALVALPVEQRCSRGVPVVELDDVRLLAADLEELQT